MHLETLRIDGEGPVRHLVLDRPHVHNAVSRQVIADLLQACIAIDGDPSIRVVILRGEGASLSSGADLKERLPSTADGMMVVAKDGARMYDAVMHLSAITIACCHGYMIGGGSILPAACDFRIGAPSIELTINEVGIGYNLTWNSLPALIALVGPQKAKEMLVLGRTYDMEGLAVIGYLTSTVGSDDELVPAAEELAAEVVRQPPVPVAVSKASINAQAQAMGRAIQHLDHVTFGLLGQLQNTKIARRSYFGRQPREWVDE